MVLDKCAEVQQILQSKSLGVLVDSTSKFTPGQRMRYWYEKGCVYLKTIALACQSHDVQSCCTQIQDISACPNADLLCDVCAIPQSCREEKGVKVRIELGPKDAEQNTCIVARCQATPGTVAFKRASEVGTEMCDMVNQMLHMNEEDVPEGKIDKLACRIQDTAPQKCGLLADGPTCIAPCACPHMHAF